MSADVFIFEDEDEQGLIAEFVRLSALYPTYPAGEIAQAVFRYARDPLLRSQQAAEVWSNDLTIKERIRVARLNGGVEPKPIASKEEQLAMLYAIANDNDVAIKERLAAHRLIAEMQGHVVKAVEKKIDDGRVPRVPTILYAQYADG